MEPSNEQKLKAAIQAVLASGVDLSDLDAAHAVNRAEPGVVADWALGKLAALIHSQRGHRPADPAQMAFPFHDLSVQIPLPKGEKTELRGATIGVLKASEKFLMAKQREKLDRPARSNSLLGRIQREIELMQPWIYVNRRITAEKVHALVLAGTPLPPRNTAPLSEAMKRYWAGMSPDERSYLTQERQAKRRRKERGAGA